MDLRLDMLRLLGIPAHTRALEIFCDQGDAAAQARVNKLVDAQTGVLVAVAAGGANPAKRYPADLTAQVIELLRASHLEVILTSGPGEAEFAQRILKYLPALCRISLMPVFPIWRRSIVIAHSTLDPIRGPKHIAVACGLPTVGNLRSRKSPELERSAE
ncbi:MAG: hypothetical protein IPH10_08260 [bacterium]|nr:hypothetical protein [bacterium]